MHGVPIKETKAASKTMYTMWSKRAVCVKVSLGFERTLGCIVHWRSFVWHGQGFTATIGEVLEQSNRTVYSTTRIVVLWCLSGEPSEIAGGRQMEERTRDLEEGLPRVLPQRATAWNGGEAQGTSQSMPPVNRGRSHEPRHFLEARQVAWAFLARWTYPICNPQISFIECSECTCWPPEGSQRQLLFSVMQLQTTSQCFAWRGLTCRGHAASRCR